jgi:UDP-N-acetyl-D-mannosaminuronic acid dehydrogenase
MVKLMENTFSDVNIALANEFALIADTMGVDVWEAIDIANRHPRARILRPGPGVRGHCIAVDPWFLIEVAPQQTPLISQARLVNDGMPAYGGLASQ